MTDREKLNELLGNIDKLKETQPATFIFFEQLMKGLKPEIEKLLTDSEKQTETKSNA